VAIADRPWNADRFRDLRSALEIALKVSLRSANV
jgi:hypothetical protein